MTAPDGDVCTLRDGSQVLVRPIRPEDKAELQRGLERLSERSRYLRFFSPVSQLNDTQLEYLTEVDQVNHVAWVAGDLSEPGLPGVGVARYVRLVEEPSVAEAAVAVVDDHQGRGLGTLLLGYLVRSALQNGIGSFRGYVLADNRAMLEIFKGAGAALRSAGAGSLQVDLPLPPDPADFPDTPVGRVFRAVSQAGGSAAGQLPETV